MEISDQYLSRMVNKELYYSLKVVEILTSTTSGEHWTSKYLKHFDWAAHMSLVQ